VAGTSVTLVMSGVNLTVLTILDGESAWLCLLLCNLDGSSRPRRVDEADHRSSDSLHADAALADLQGRRPITAFNISGGT
jgi:hypothetical protein